MYSVATYMRQIKNDAGEINYLDSLSRSIEYILDDSTDYRYIDKFGPAFDRIAYLDFTIDAIKNSNEYADVVSLPLEIASIVDGLTPGFDIFNAPKIANVLSAVYLSQPDRKYRVNSESYQSDQLGVYGEYFILFYKWLSLPLFTISAYILVRIYYLNFFKNTFNSLVWRAFILSLFYQWLISYGLDWLIIYSIINYIALFFILFLIKPFLYLKNIRMV